MDQPHISGKAVLITGGLLNSINAKTAHGLLRVSNRFEIIGVIDEKHAGKDAGIVVDGQELGIPVAG
ncbi:MAG: putative NAD-dependent epimerase/dehydratase family protein, partial [Cyclobacteriaceae bacterium]